MVMNSKILVIVTVIVLAVISVIGLQFKKHESLLVSTKMGITGNPTLGSPKANIDIVVFEEPKCPACKTFSDTIYPKIRKNFVATNKATYTLIPISFIKNSMPAAIALFCVYHQDKDFPNSELFFKYVEHMYANQPSESEDWATPETLKKFATETSPVIKIDAFQDCLRN
jgi:protein-disulfide isomerase